MDLVKGKNKNEDKEIFKKDKEIWKKNKEKEKEKDFSEKDNDFSSEEEKNDLKDEGSLEEGEMPVNIRPSSLPNFISIQENFNTNNKIDEDIDQNLDLDIEIKFIVSFNEFRPVPIK